MSFEQNKIDAVEHKLHALSVSMEQLNQSMGEMKLGLEALRREKQHPGQSLMSGLIGGDYGNLENSRMRSFVQHHHKDILDDGESFEGDERSEGRHLAPEMQVQRLTAQLTAAYSRIAALEEQLLSQRMH